MNKNSNSSADNPPLSGAEFSGAPDRETTPPVIRGYEIIRVIGEGGMGVVYEAYQEIPRRRVAIKILRAGLLTPALLRRFTHEVEVLGRLEHPTIARIYDAGSSETGGVSQPYFAMEFIEGLPIIRYAKEHQFSVREKVELIQKVAHGVQYAHQKGIIHRDITPANILVNTQGQPKILDFGVARATETDMRLTLAPTDVGVLLGTLLYMSPEQASGNVAEVDVRTDVYALGMLTFELLAGQTPYRLDPKRLDAAIRTIHEIDPPPISSLNRELAGDLEVIVQKAIEKDKERRYSSAEAFAEDINRFLQNRPIAARPPSVSYRISKFAKRHRALAIAILAGFLALGTGTTLAVVGLLRARAAQVEARNAEAQAIRERERAERNLAKALSTVDQFTTYAAESQLADIPKAAPVRAQLLRDAVAFYEDLSEDNQDDPQLQEELSWSLARLAQNKLDSGEKQESRELVEQRIERLSALLQSDPMNADYSRDLARSWSSLGKIFEQIGEQTRAMEAVERAISLLRPEVIRAPQNVLYSQDLAHSLGTKAALAAQHGDLALAVESAEEAVSVGNNIIRLSPDLPDAQRNVARSYMILARIQARAPDKSQQIASIQHAQKIYESIFNSNSRNPESRIDLARSQSELGIALLRANEPARALQLLEQAGAHFSALTAAFPNNPDYLRALARNMDETAHAHSRMNDHAQALAIHEKATADFRALVEKRPENTAYARDLARNLAETGQSAARTGNAPKAEKSFKESFKIYGELLSGDPNSRALKMDTAYLLGNWAAISSDAEALTRLNQAQGIWNELNRQYPQNPAIGRAARWTAQQIEERTMEDSPSIGMRRLQPNPVTDKSSNWETPSGPENRSPPENPRRLKANDIVRLRENAGEYVRVQGRVVSARLNVGRTRLSFIQFGTAPRDFVALLHQNVLPLFQETYGNYLEELTGQNVEIEGILSIFSGTPQIALNRPDQIHILTTEKSADPSVFRSSAVGQIRKNVGKPINVAGRISLVNSTRDDSIHFLEFENRPGAKFTALIRERHREAIEAALGGPLPQILPGRRVQISGIPYLHRGNPNIEIRDPDQITLLTDKTSE